MGRQTIYLNAATWFQNNDSTNHSSAEWLKCTRPNGPDNYSFAAVLNFALPTALKYKKITRVQLNYYTKRINGGQEDTQGWQGMSVAPYVCPNTAISQITGANYLAYGTEGEYITVEPYQYYNYITYPCWRVADITSIFASNLYESTYFTLIMRGLPGLTDGSYGLIGSSASGYIPYIVVDYDDVEQLAPSPNYPVGAYVTENTDLLFAWTWNATTGATQASVQLEYKLASAGSWTVVSLTQTGHTYTLSGGLAQGAYKWRIKGTNDAGESSGYSSEAEFTVIGQPAAPVISTPANKAATTIEWTAADQNSFDIKLVDSNNVELINETVASSVSSYKPNMLLKGSYTVSVRYRNSTGLSSNWASKAFTINASGPTAPTFTLYGEGENVRAVITRAANTSYALYRALDDGNNDFEPVGVITGTSFTDKTLKFNTPYVYKVRAWATGGYTDTAVQRYRSESERICLQADNTELYLGSSDEEYLPYDEDATRDMSLIKCPGRKYPVAEHGEVDSWIFRTKLFVTEEQKETLKEIAWNDYIYFRDYSGRAFPVAINTLSFTRFMKEGYLANIEFARIAEREVELNV